MKMTNADARIVMADPPTGRISNACNQVICTYNNNTHYYRGFMLQRDNYYNLILIFTQTVPEADTNQCGRRRFRSTCHLVMHNAIKRQ